MANIDMGIAEDALEPIAVIPEGPRVTWETPEHYLWAAVLETAIWDARLGMEDAVSWIRSEQHLSIQDFEAVCEVLGYNPGAVRRAILGGINGKT